MGDVGNHPMLRSPPDMDSPIGYWSTSSTSFPWVKYHEISDETHQYQHMAETHVTVFLWWNMCTWMFQHTMLISQLQSIYWFPSGWLVWLPTQKISKKLSHILHHFFHHGPIISHWKPCRRRQAEAMAGGRRRGGRRPSIHRMIWSLALRNRWKSGFEKWKMDSRDFLTMKKWFDAETLVKTQQPKCGNLGGPSFSLRTPSHQVTPLSWPFDLQRK